MKKIDLTDKQIVKRGEPDPVQNAREIGQVWTTVSLIEPDTVATPVNVWL